MEVSHGRVEPHGFESGGHVVRQERVKEREQRVHVIERRPAAAFTEEKVLLLRRDQMVEDSKVGPRRVALDATHGIERRGLPQVIQKPRQALGRCLELRRLSGLGTVARAAKQHGAAVGNLGDHHGAGNLGGLLFAVGPAVLLPPQENVAGDRP